eukprot:TRINITY_DN2271_c0_g1_i1.p1 TRINITY_DN2271_c0_g1~~TRINITY_DN2271_c0_g1_i1.p1  ORF type:complete len:71 (+),score=1.77 TRINITY_DN2271_c0_g1_i1:157-369(+)
MCLNFRLGIQDLNININIQNLKEMRSEIAKPAISGHTIFSDLVNFSHTSSWPIETEMNLGIFDFYLAHCV